MLLQRLTLHNQDNLEGAEPDTMHLCLYHLPARLTCHARRRVLCIEQTWPCAAAFTTNWNRLTQLPAAHLTADPALMRRGLG
ncbi:transposase [Streptomyces sp. NBC_01754]|uniref:hypothetical protein n=1 Tax=Streptomyces sp. NBC_01754 TaxID=2975930 RepID=UPI002DD8EDDD|nr:hypothetical protein [Streptomyces sp. NBC_01754]WSC96530.1 transposase [Streptomyces sp. NBC_01754]